MKWVKVLVPLVVAVYMVALIAVESAVGQAGPQKAQAVKEPMQKGGPGGRAGAPAAPAGAMAQKGEDQPPAFLPGGPAEAEEGVPPEDAAAQALRGWLTHDVGLLDKVVYFPLQIVEADGTLLLLRNEAELEAWVAGAPTYGREPSPGQAAPADLRCEVVDRAAAGEVQLLQLVVPTGEAGPDVAPPLSCLAMVYSTRQRMRPGPPRPGPAPGGPGGVCALTVTDDPSGICAGRLVAARRLLLEATQAGGDRLPTQEQWVALLAQRPAGGEAAEVTCSTADGPGAAFELAPDLAGRTLEELLAAPGQPLLACPGGPGQHATRWQISVSGVVTSVEPGAAGDLGRAGAGDVVGAMYEALGPGQADAAIRRMAFPHVLREGWGEGDTIWEDEQAFRAEVPAGEAGGITVVTEQQWAAFAGRAALVKSNLSLSFGPEVVPAMGVAALVTRDEAGWKLAGSCFDWEQRAYGEEEAGGPREPNDPCLSNLTALGAVLRKYAADHEGRLPPAATWQSALMVYVLGKRPSAASAAPKQGAAIFVCPRDSACDPGYAFNAELGGRVLAEVPDASQTPLLFESGLGIRNVHGSPELLAVEPSRHDGLRAVLMADLTARFVPPELHPLSVDRLLSLADGATRAYEAGARLTRTPGMLLVAPYVTGPDPFGGAGLQQMAVVETHTGDWTTGDPNLPPAEGQPVGLKWHLSDGSLTAAVGSVQRDGTTQHLFVLGGRDTGPAGAAGIKALLVVPGDDSPPDTDADREAAVAAAQRALHALASPGSAGGLRAPYVDGLTDYPPRLVTTDQPEEPAARPPTPWSPSGLPSVGELEAAQVQVRGPGALVLGRAPVEVSGRGSLDSVGVLLTRDGQDWRAVAVVGERLGTAPSPSSGECTRRLTELGRVLLGWAAKHAGRLPTAEAWLDDVLPLCSGPEILWCPVWGPELNYLYNPDVAGKRLDDIPDKARSPLLCCPMPHPGRGRVGVVLADGQVQVLDYGRMYDHRAFNRIMQMQMELERRLMQERGEGPPQEEMDAEPEVDEGEPTPPPEVDDGETVPRPGMYAGELVTPPPDHPRPDKRRGGVETAPQYPTVPGGTMKGGRPKAAPVP